VLFSNTPLNKYMLKSKTPPPSPGDPKIQKHECKISISLLFIQHNFIFKRKILF
jgi:hypothetical protein